MNNNRKMNVFKRVTQFAGLYSIIGGLPLAMPIFFRQFYILSNKLAAMLSIGGTQMVPPVEGVNMLFINTAGLLMVFMGFLLLYAAEDLYARLGIPLLIGLARLFFSAIVVYYKVAENISDYGS